jgi:hypothetical protein
MTNVAFGSSTIYSSVVTELANDPTNWWGPNEHCVRELLLGYGFNEIEITAHPGGHNRAIFHAWRSTEARIKPLAKAKQLEYEKRHPILGRARSALNPIRRMFAKQPSRIDVSASFMLEWHLVHWLALYNRAYLTMITAIDNRNLATAVL